MEDDLVFLFLFWLNQERDSIHVSNLFPAFGHLQNQSLRLRATPPPPQQPIQLQQVNLLNYLLFCPLIISLLQPHPLASLRGKYICNKLIFTYQYHTFLFISTYIIIFSYMPLCPVIQQLKCLNGKTTPEVLEVFQNYKNII